MDPFVVVEVTAETFIRDSSDKNGIIDRTTQTGSYKPVPQKANPARPSTIVAYQPTRERVNRPFIYQEQPRGKACVFCSAQCCR